MSFINHLISEELVYAIGWTLIHSLWQGMIVAFVTAIILISLRKKSAQTRYLATNFALFSVLLLAIITFFDLYQPVGNQSGKEITLLAEGTQINITASASLLEGFFNRTSEYFNQNLPLIAGLWLIGLALFLLKFMGGLAYIWRLKNKYCEVLPDFWQQKLADLAREIKLKRTVELMESALVKTPVVVGYFKPVILFPIGAVNGLSLVQTEAVLAHELAHIFRNDYLFNIFQSLIEILFYFNPAVWWISANIRAERENCCDDIAVKVCGDTVTYAKALLGLQEMSQAAPGLAMAFSNGKTPLLNRVKRILNHPQKKSVVMEKFIATFLLLAAILMLSVSAENPYGSTIETEEMSVSTDASFTDGLRNISEEVNVMLHTETGDMASEELLMLVDTLPKGKTKLDFENDEQKVKATIEKGKITFLEIDGKVIPETELSEHETFVEELLGDIPSPSELHGRAVAPDVFHISPPPRPPRAPRPPKFAYEFNNKVKTWTDDEGNVTIIIDEDEIPLPDTEELIWIEKEFGEQEKLLKLNEDKLIILMDKLKDAKENREVYILRGEELRRDEKRAQERAMREFERARRLKEGGIIMKEIELKEFNKQLKEHEHELENMHFFSPDIPRVMGMETFKFRGHDLESALERQMIKDGFIEEAANYKLKLSPNQMRVNGKKASLAQLQNYLKIYKDYTGMELSAKSKVVIDKKK